MPLACALPSNLYSKSPSCLQEAGVKAVKIIQSDNVDLAAINLALATYFDVATLSFKSVQLPLIATKKWSTLTPSREGVKHTATQRENQTSFDINIEGMKFEGYLDNNQTSQMIRSVHNVTSTLLNSGDILVDGLTYDVDLGKIVVDTHKMHMKITDLVQDSGVLGDEMGLNTTFNIKGAQDYKSYIAKFAWAAMDSF